MQCRTNAATALRISLIAILLAPFLVRAQSVRLVDPDAMTEARTLATQLLKSEKIPGLSVAVGVGEEIVWSAGFGWSDMENRVSVTPLTRFRVGSVSKSLTATALAQLWEDGKLDMDAPVQQYVPDFPTKRWPVTTRQVAGHLAGIRHYRGQEFLMNRPFATVAEGLEIFAADTLLYRPGERYAYSSYGWNLISAVIEGASGEPFLDYMRRRVFGRLGMRNTVADFPDSLIAYRTRFYTRTADGTIVNAECVDNSYKWAGGGFLANTEDLVRFGLAHLKPGFLKKRSLEQLHTSQKTDDGEETNYGLGWRVRVNDSGQRWVGHSGGSVGGTAFLVLYPEQQVVVAVLANRGGVRWKNLQHQIARKFMQ